MTNSVEEQIAGLTDIGQLRAVNEDAILIDEEIKLYAISDGMGGHGSGDIASRLALSTLQSCIAAEPVAKALSSDNISDEQALALVFQSIAGVNQRIFQKNEENGHTDGTGMGTTLVGLCMFGNSQRAVSFNVGDSRLYEYRNDVLSQLTRDHTMYREWEESGRIGPAPPRNIIMRAMGLFAEVDIDLEVIAMKPEASYLLCSDGLTGMVDDSEMATLMADSGDAEATTRSLVQRANERGGTDNISVITILRKQWQ